METFLIKALQLVLSISLLVILHEGGHFFFAKLFGIRVHRFCLFFDFWKGGKRLALPLGTWGGTKFAIGWLPSVVTWKSPAWSTKAPMPMR